MPTLPMQDNLAAGAWHGARARLHGQGAGRSAMPMPACPECGTTLTFLVCGSGEHPTLYKCMFCRVLFLGIESAARSRARGQHPGRGDLSEAVPRGAPDAPRG